MQGITIFRLHSLKRIEKTLSGVEKRNGVGTRWKIGEQAFESLMNRLKTKKQHACLLTLHRIALERIFLLELKAKYAGTVRQDVL